MSYLRPRPMSDTDQSDTVDAPLIASWLNGIPSPPLSPPANGRSSVFASHRKRPRKKEMSQPPRKRKGHSSDDAVTEALSDHSLSVPVSDRVRPSSPARELREIYRYAKPPIRFITTPDSETPSPIVDLYKTLQRSAAAVISADLKDRIDSSFSYQNIPISAYTSNEESTSAVDVERAWDRAVYSLLKAKQAFEGNEPEGSWIRLAAETLDGVFQSSDLQGLLRTMDVQYSDVNSPTLLPRVNNVAIPVKKADLAVAIHNSKPAAGGIYDQIRENNPTMTLSQMKDASVARMTLPVCVEVGEPGKSYTEASVQLGVWCCAGLLKLEALRRQQAYIPKDLKIPLIGFTAIGMDWKIHIAYQLPVDGAVVILGPLNCGGYQDVYSYFVLESTARSVASWAERTYWPHFKNIFTARS